MLRPLSRPTGHARLTHEAWQDLGHDWSLVGDPDAPPQPPFKVYLPRCTEDVVRAVREARTLGHAVIVRGAGHSSNRLVTSAEGAVLLTTAMDRVLAVDELGGTVTVQAGAAVVAVDDLLSGRGRGLQITPDHGDITVGGFASVGGLGPTSLHDGMFVDAVEALVYVDLDGAVRRCDRADGTRELLAVLAGLGRHGVITELTLRTVPADKRHTLLENRRQRFRAADELAAATVDVVASPGDAVAVRGSWLDLPALGGVGRGVLSAYRPATRTTTGRLRARGAYGALHGLGRLSTALPGGLGVAAKYAASAGLMQAPRYASALDVQRFSDGILDWTVGEPSRLLVALAPLETTAEVFSGMLDAALTLRDRESCLTFVSLHLKGIRSPYLSGGDPDAAHVELLMVVGVDQHWMTPALMQQLADSVDAVCTQHGAFRYMHTLSRGGDLDPSTRYQVSAVAAVA